MLVLGIGAAFYFGAWQAAVTQVLTRYMERGIASVIGTAVGLIPGLIAFYVFIRIAERERDLKSNDFAAMVYRPAIIPAVLVPLVLLACVRFPLFGLAILSSIVTPLIGIVFLQKHFGRPFSWLICSIYGVLILIMVFPVVSWLFSLYAPAFAP